MASSRVRFTVSLILVTSEYTTNYSNYLTSGYAPTTISHELGGPTITVSTGLDVGAHVEKFIVTYSRPEASEGRSVIIRTNHDDSTLTVNAPKDTVKHYNNASAVDIKAVASNSYHENGKVGFVSIEKGRFVAEGTSEVKAIVSTGESGEVVIEKQSTATIVKAYATKTSTQTGNVTLEQISGTEGEIADSIAAIKEQAEIDHNPTYEVNGTYYKTLGDVIEKVPLINGNGYNFTGEWEIKLLKDVTDCGFDVAKNGKLDLDLNNHTYTINTTVGSTGTTTNGIHPLNGSTLNIKNGKINSSAGKMIVNAYGDFNAENVIFDCSKMSINNYGANYGEYAGLECGIFLSNQNSLGRCNMVLTNCQIIMPTNSVAGVCVDGNLTLNNTQVTGAISIDTNGILKMDSSSSASKGVRTYFASATKAESVEGSYTVYSIEK